MLASLKLLTNSRTQFGKPSENSLGHCWENLLYRKPPVALRKPSEYSLGYCWENLQKADYDPEKTFRKPLGTLMRKPTESRLWPSENLQKTTWNPVEKTCRKPTVSRDPEKTIKKLTGTLLRKPTESRLWPWENLQKAAYYIYTLVTFFLHSMKASSEKMNFQRREHYEVCSGWLSKIRKRSN